MRPLLFRFHPVFWYFGVFQCNYIVIALHFLLNVQSFACEFEIRQLHICQSLRSFIIIFIGAFWISNTMVLIGCFGAYHICQNVLLNLHFVESINRGKTLNSSSVCQNGWEEEERQRSGGDCTETEKKEKNTRKTNDQNVFSKWCKK